MNKEIGYLAITVNIAFLLNVMAARAKIQAVLMQIYLMIKNVLMLFVVKAKAYALYIKKYGTEKYANTILELMRKGYNYPREFKNINDIEKILEIFESRLNEK